jgi:hypothetical protein
VEWVDGDAAEHADGDGEKAREKEAMTTRYSPQCPWVSEDPEGTVDEPCHGTMMLSSTTFSGDGWIYEYWKCQKCERHFLRGYRWKCDDKEKGRWVTLRERLETVWFGPINMEVVVEFSWSGDSGIHEMIGQLTEDVEYIDVDGQKRKFYRGNQVLAKRRRGMGGRLDAWVLSEMVDVSRG